MLWLILAAGGVGCLLGLCMMRTPIVALTSFALVLVCAGFAPFAPWDVWSTLGLAVALIGTLQAGYLVGLLASVAWMRTNAPHKILRSSHNDQRSM